MVENEILIRKIGLGYIVSDYDADTNKHTILGYPKTKEAAWEIADKYLETHKVKYGTRFIPKEEDSSDI